MKNFSQITENLDVANKKYVDDELDKLARTVNNGALTLTVNGTAHTFTANQSEDTSVTINDTGVTSVSLTGDGNAVTNASIDGRALTLTKGTTFLTSQSIKTLNTNNTTAQTTSASETIVGSGTINLHKVAKTGSYNDLLDTPPIPAVNNGALTLTVNGTAHTFTANQSGDTSVTINDTGVTSVSVTGSGNAVTDASIGGRTMTLTKGATFLTSQSIKSINTNNTAAQDPNASEAIVGTGTINLHKIAKTGSYDDLNDKPNLARHSSTLLASNTDLNTLHGSDKVGWYHCGGGNSCANKPSGVKAFGLEVGRSAEGYYFQVLTDGNAHPSRRYVRTYGSAWTAWQKLAITSEIPAVHDGTLTIQKNGTAVATFTANSALNTIANIKVPSTFDDLSRIKKQAYTGGNNTVQYFKLATFPVYNSDGNYASFIITGRMGGWVSGNTSFVNMILYNRNGEGGGYINVANSSFFNLCDIVMYREADGTSTAYLKVKSYYTFDINVNTYQATNVYTGTDVPPTGTLKWTASANADRLAVSGGKVYVNGFMMPKQIRINDTVRNPDANAVIDLGTVPASYTTSSLTPSKCTKNGFYYVISSTNSLTDADGNPFLQYHTSDKDFRILTTAYSDSWVQQIATDLRTNHIFYRIRNNGTWGAWQKMMNAEEFSLSGTTLTITM